MLKSREIYSISSKKILIDESQVHQIIEENFMSSVYDILKQQAKSLQIISYVKLVTDAWSRNE